MDALTQLLLDLAVDRRTRIAQLAAAALRGMEDGELRALAEELAGDPAVVRFCTEVMEAYNEGR